MSATSRAAGAEALVEALGPSFAGRIERDFPLARLTTYRVGGAAYVYVEPSSMDDVELLARALRDHHAPVLALGRGSNLVVSDRGFPGIVLRLGAGFSWIEPADVGDLGGGGLRAGAATTLPVLANFAARRSLAGLEFMVAVPGSVGGAVRMNAGAHGSEISDTLVSCTLFDLEELRVNERPVQKLGYSYRRSNLTARHVVLEARFALKRDEQDAIKARMESFRRHRAATQPGAVQNAGSVFKNPPGDSAGRLVEAAGLKGFRVGGAAVSELHANFFIAGEGSSAQDVFDLVQAVRARVVEVHGVHLEPEIRFVGRFEDKERVEVDGT
ncbi:MAG: UDP-N-acetylmuramate dehydrogenase [Actinomycetota bacterium]